MSRKSKAGDVQSSCVGKWKDVVEFWSWPVERLLEPLDRRAVKLGDSEKKAVVMLKSYRSGAG